MAITIKAPELKSNELSRIPIGISASADSGTIGTVTISGLPGDASVATATRTTQGSWEIQFADLPTAAITLARRPQKPLSLNIVAEGTDATGAAQTATAIASLEIGAIASTSQKGKIVLAIALVAFNVALFICWRQLYERAQSTLTTDWTVQWEQPAELLLDPGPITFWYDSTKKELHHRGPIDKGLKSDLIKLAHITKAPGSAGGASASAATNAPPSSTKEDDLKAAVVVEDSRLLNYAGAISKLAFDSNSLIDNYFLYLLSIAGLSGMIGTQIRAFANFIYLSTQTNKLDVKTWWPWYALRPALGFLLGLTVVLLVQAKLFVPTTDSPPSGTAWWMALAMLVGFGADDFAQRLRLVAQALFGKDK
jgi:hypothetical protein